MGKKYENAKRILRCGGCQGITCSDCYASKAGNCTIFGLVDPEYSIFFNEKIADYEARHKAKKAKPEGILGRSLTPEEIVYIETEAQAIQADADRIRAAESKPFDPEKAKWPLFCVYDQDPSYIFRITNIDTWGRLMTRSADLRPATLAEVTPMIWEAQK